MTVDDFRAAVRPKVQGSWNLHQQLADLDFFVMLSSLVGVMGGASQANYAAGGAFQDALASFRRMQGLPAVTVDLGMVKGVGYVASTRGISERLARIGYKPIYEDEVLRILESAILSPSAAQIITGINTRPGAHWEEANWIKESRFAGLKYHQSTQKSTSGGQGNTANAGKLRGQLPSASSLAEASELILHAITMKLTNMFGVAEEEIVPSKDLAEYGVDSLIAVELRNWIAAQAASDISIFELMQSPSLTELSAIVAAKSSQIDPALLSKK
jgi:aryl carrier-like protein